MLKNGERFSVEDRRKLYVAFTRAKNNLYIQINGKGLARYSKLPNLDYKYDNNEYPSPLNICVQLNYRDVVLSFFKSRLREVTKLIPGSELSYKDGYLVDTRGITLVKFSQAFDKKYNEILNMGYEFDKSAVRFVVAWYDKEDERDYPIVLADIYFKKN